MVFIQCYDINDTLIATGSGFAIDSNGSIVTNYHVVEGCNRVTATFEDGTILDVSSVFNYDVERDIAILKVDGTNLPTVPLGDSDKVLNGQRVLAIGSPLGLSNTISEGLVSSKNREIDGLRFIQTSAPISDGSSGGALLDSNGQVIGITSAIFVEGQNLNLAIPINDLKPLLQVNRELSIDEMYEEIRLSTPFGLFSKTLSSRKIWLYWDFVEDAEYYHIYKSYGGFTNYPYTFAYNSITEDNAVYYDEEDDTWSVWAPLLVIVSDKDADEYYYEWIE